MNNSGLLLKNILNECGIQRKEYTSGAALLEVLNSTDAPTLYRIDYSANYEKGYWEIVMYLTQEISSPYQYLPPKRVKK